MSKAPSTTRRALLGALATTAGGVALSPALAVAINAGLDRTQWDATMSKLAVARARYKASGDAADQTYALYKARAPQYPKVDRLHFMGIPDYRLFDQLDLDKHTADFNAGEGVLWSSPSGAARRSFEASIAAIRDYRAKVEAAAVASRYREANDVSEADLDAVCLLLNELMQMPAPDLPALLWKLEEAFGTDKATYPDSEESTPGTCRRHLAQTFADMRRLLGGEA